MLAKIKFQRLKQDQLKLEKKKAKLRGKKKTMWGCKFKK
jgi:hypothetical protein